MKKALSMVLAFTMILGLFTGVNFGFGISAKAATNESTTLDNNKEDVFAALGFDTSETPDGYDADTTSNPYGRDKTTGNQVFEVLAATSGGTMLYGNNDNTVQPTALSSISTGGVSMPTVKLFSGAPGDFNGDGLAGEVAYVGFDSLHYLSSTTSNLCLYIYDSALNTYSGAKDIGDVNPYYTYSAANETQRKNQSAMDAAWQNLLQIATGDFDGDGTSEIAVYVAQSGSARVDIYKYGETSNAAANAWLDMSNWTRVWSYAVSSASNAVPNMVSLVSGDFNRDGVDDLGISYGRAVYNVASTNAFFANPAYAISYTYTGKCLEADASQARILWGGTSGMLQSNSALDLGASTFGSLIRVSLAYGDADADGTKDLVMAGEPYEDRNANFQRAVGLYTYAEGDGLALTVSQLIKVVDAENMEFPTYDSDGNPTGSTTTNTVSKNGFDTKNLSSPVMRCNAAVVTPDRSGYPYIYVDSTLCKYLNKSLSIAYELDDSKCIDGSGTDNSYLPWATTRDSTYLSSNLFNLIGNSSYCEYGAVSGDINGAGNQILLTNYVGTSNTFNMGYTAAEVFNESYSGMRGSYKGYSVLYKGGSLGVTAQSHPTTSGSLWALSPTVVALTMPDTDKDTTLIEYSGIHYLTYSDPKVLAVIAAAPYFEDVDIISDYDYAWQNTTSWASTSGSGSSSLVSVDFEIGGYFEGDYTIAGAAVGIEASAGFTMEWENETTKTYEYTLTFETSQDEDSVAFYCIPTECYVYYISVPDGNGGYTKTTDILTNSFSPCFQILSLDYYESIQGDYDSLPQIEGKAITSTPGDPSSYPSSTSGYSVIAAWNQDPAGVSFGNGSISQEITISNEVTNTFNFGANVEFKIGAGGQGWSSLVQSGAHVKAGAYFSLNPAGGFAVIDLSGTTISGTVTNMPTEFQDFGYYYNWKLFSYNYTFSDGTSVPVVSYVVGDVSEPPKLPADFKQDYARSTSDTNCLTWTYSGSAKDFYIYKYGDYPEGSGLQLIATIGAGDSTHYTLKQDADGNYYKEFYYNDGNLTPYTEYKYCIQVERSSPIPPLSAPSAYLTARTKAADGNPLLTVSESDGANDATLLVYPDKNSYLTVGVTGPKGQLSSNYYTTVLFQWQKLVNGAWTDMDNEKSMTLTFASAGVSSAGTYRCRVNVLTRESATYITAYTDSITVTHSKRSTHISEVWAHDASPTGVEVYAKVVNDHADSATIPNGTVLFTLTSGTTGLTYQFVADVDSNGVANEIVDEDLPDGVYSVYAYYSGSYVFKPSSAESVYLSKLGSGYTIDAPSSITYGDGGSLTFLQLSKTGGVTTSTPRNAADIYLYQADTASLTSISNAASIVKGGAAVMGTSYTYKTEDGDVYFFTATRTGTVTMDGKYVYYSEIPVTGYITESSLNGAYVYNIAKNTPAGGYVVQMTASDTSGNITGSSWASFTVKQREVTLQLPVKVGSEGVALSDPTLGSLTITSGSFAPCDLTGGTLNSTLAGTVVALTYTNTAKSTFNVSNVSNTCGYYTASRAVTSTLLSNYKLSFLSGSVSILGATHALQVGARPFSGGDVGTVYVVSPDYKYTRDTITYDSGSDTYTASINLNYQAGTRVVLYAVPDSGYEVYDWYVNGVAQNSTATSFPYVMYAEGTRIEVQFAVKQSSLIFGTAGDTGGGTLTCSDNSLSSGSIVLSNSKFTFTATANEGYHFKEWRYTELGSGTAYDTVDTGKRTSTFYFIMPVRSCTLYAVFERDSYTLTLNDESGKSGLTAWYYASATDEAAGTKTWVTGTTASIKGDTEVTVQPATGFLLDDAYAYVSQGSQGAADYGAGTYTIHAITQNTKVTCRTVQQGYDVTVKFNVAGSTAQSADAAIDCTAGDKTQTYLYTAGDTFTAEDVAGGSTVAVTGSCASYYTLEGWESSLNSPVTAIKSSEFTAAETSWQTLATEVADGGAVISGSVYKYSSSGNTYYFKATETGKVLIDGTTVHNLASGDGYGISKLGSDVTLTLYLTEKPIHTITLRSIADTDGTYSYSLPVGATEATVGSDTVITLHDGDDFPVTVTPAAGRTVTYWEVSYNPEGTLLTSKYRATSLTYTQEDIGYDYTIEPIFAASTYNTVSWPTIGNTINGITLTPVNGCLSSVASGSSFTFKLEGSASALALIDKVYGNGYEFTAAGNEQGGSTYSYDSTAGTYTITNITANQVITLTFHKIGLTVNDTDISAFSGTGWTYNAASQVLTISGSSSSSSSSVLSGSNSQTYAPKLTVVLDSSAGSVTFDGLELTSAADGYLVSSLRTTGISVTATGTNTLTQNNSSTTSAILLYTVNNLTVRGAGSLTLNLNRAKGATATKGIYCKGEFFVTGTVDMTVNVPMAADQASGGITNTVGICSGKFTMGVQDSLTSAPSLKVYLYGHDGVSLQSNYYSTGIFVTDDTMTVWTGSLLVCSNIGLYVPHHYIYNFGGSTEVYSLNGAIYYPQNAYWKVDYSPDGSTSPSGFLACYGPSDTNFVTKTFGVNDSIVLDGYHWEDFLWDFFGLHTDDTSPLESKYLRIAPATVSDPGITVTVTDPDAATYSGTVALSSGTGGDGTYFYYNDNGKLKPKAASDIHHSDYKDGTVFYAMYSNGDLDLKEFDLGLDEQECAATLVNDDPIHYGVVAAPITGTDVFPVVAGHSYYYYYYDSDISKAYYLYFTTGYDGWVDSEISNITTATKVIVSVADITSPTADLSYTLSGVDAGLDISTDSATSLSLVGLTAQSLLTSDACTTFNLSGNNYLAGTVDGRGALSLAYTSSTLNIVSDGTGTLSAINASTADHSCGIAIVSNDPLNLKLTNVKALSAYGAEGGIVATHGYTVSYYDDVLSDADGVYGYGWQADAGASSATATIQKGSLVGTTSLAGLTTDYVKYYSITSAAGYTVPLVYDKGVSANDVLATTVYCPTVMGKNHLFDSVKLAGETDPLTEGADYTWTADAAKGTLTLLESGAIGSLAVGSYTLVVSFFDEYPADATYYTLEIPFTVKNTQASTNGIFINPDTITLSRGGTKTFTTTFEGTTPKTYKWYLDGVEITGATSSSYALTVASGAAFGTHTLTVKAYEDAAATAELGTATATVTVAPKATEIAISCATETPSGDGSYTLYHNNLSTWNFVAAVSLDNDTTVNTVTWSLWGAKLKLTAVNSSTGALSIATNETGTEGILQLKATYKNDDGSETDEVVTIHLSTDAHVGYSNTGAVNGAITSVVYGEAQNAIPAAGAWLPAGSTVTAIATPDAEYEVNHWYVNGVSVMDDDAYTVSDDGSTLTFTTASMGKYVITADYINMYNFAITFSAGANGSLTAAQDGVNFASGYAVLKNTSVTFSAVPDTYYQVKSWTVDGEVYENPAGTVYTGTSLTLSDITEDHEVSVVFEGVPVTVTYVAGINTADTSTPVSPHGTLSLFDDGTLLSAAPVTGTDKSLTYTATVNAMSAVNIFANPAAGYQVKCWYVWSDGKYVAVNSSAEVANYYTANLTGTLKVKAEFEPIPSYNVTVSVDSYQNGGGTVTSGTNYIPYIQGQSKILSMGLTVKRHGNLTLLATPDAGSYLYEWRIGDAGSPNDVSYTTSGNSITLTNVTKDTKVAAVFRKVNYDVTLSSGDGGSMTAEYNLEGIEYSGTIADDGSESIKSGSTVDVTITPDTGNTIESFTVNGIPTKYTVSYVAGSGYSYTYTIPSLLAKADIDVSFTACTFYTVTAPADDYFRIQTAGADTPDTADDTYAIRGTASAAYVIDGFSKDGADAKKVDILSGGSAKLTFTPGTGFYVDASALRGAVNTVLNAAGSAAGYRIYIDSSSYVVELTGIDKALDFSAMSNVFVLRTTPVDEYTVTFSSTGNGKVTAAYNGIALVSGAKVPEDAEVVFTVTPDAHNSLTDFTDNTVDAGGELVYSAGTYTYTKTVSSDTAVTVAFEVSEYYIGITKLGTGTGTVTATANGVSITSSGYLPAGYDVAITAAADTGSSFNCMAVNSTVDTSGAYTVSSLGGSVAVTAVFDAVSKPVTYNTPANGTLKITDSAGNAIANGQIVPVGTVLVITATPNTHYALSTLLAGGTSISGNTYTVDAAKTNSIEATFAVAEVPVTWTNPSDGTIRVYDKAGADIASGSYVAVGSSILIRGVPKSTNYELSSLTMNGAPVVSGSLYTVPAIAITLSVTFKYVGDAPNNPGTTVIINEGGSGVLGEATELGEIDVFTTDEALTALGEVTSAENDILVSIDGDSFAELAGHAQSNSTGITANTDLASVTFNTTAVAYINGLAASGDVILEIKQISTSKLSAENRQAIGDHPVYSFSLTAGSVQVNSFNGGKATVTIPYTLAAGETAETVVVYCIDSDGQLQIIRGAYHASTGTVTFSTGHFSYYSFGNHPVSFSDVTETDWYYSAVRFIAAREITLGIGNGLYGPAKQITRGEFLVMLMRAYGIEPDTNPADNFSDAGDTYYTNYLAAAKRLGITNGVGNNRFAPEDLISRQDMFTLLYRALDVLGELPQGTGKANLTAYPDAGLIADYAQDAISTFVAAGVVSGSGGMLNPTGLSTRAEMAQILYNLLSK
ncbi:S-layer homology domain-containing protein [Papillibacter cinnamivorans]|uniref:S-layer homology domain-containing protein n=1 Tax=Papillibacter cinnamivorans DSM 12816 TaxID=1122930 RepID=A0A1W2BA84_9FIRM|nr:S-layer homology domain-containing protein [Papillibacter cinnamivorans]SMC69885.1 S-layer homology domain-containing protein [Papillibacter cinnamivorans DSM 12816]